MSDEEFKRQLDFNLSLNKARDEFKRLSEEAGQARKKELENYRKEFAHDMLKNDISYLFAKLKLDMELQLHRMQRDMLEQIKRLYGG
jgi:hypothetical protein